jgi:hypothetical protein
VNCAWHSHLLMTVQCLLTPMGISAHLPCIQQDAQHTSVA